jgi:hypothetical protein
MNDAAASLFLPSQKCFAERLLLLLVLWDMSSGKSRDADADHGDRSIGCLRHGGLLVFGAPYQLRLLAGQEHGRTIPLADISPVCGHSREKQAASRETPSREVNWRHRNLPVV